MLCTQPYIVAKNIIQLKYVVIFPCVCVLNYLYNLLKYFELFLQTIATTLSIYSQPFVEPLGTCHHVSKNHNS